MWGTAARVAVDERVGGAGWWCCGGVLTCSAEAGRGCCSGGAREWRQAHVWRS